MNKKMIMLGIDPGLSVSGFSVIKREKNCLYVCDYGYLSMHSKHSIHKRIGIFYAFYQEKICRFNITDIALETPFLGKNAQNYLKLGYLRGILLLLADQYSLTVHEFAPRQVKQAVTGYGNASKEQVACIILQLFPRLEKPKKEDVTDAFAVSLCALWKQS